MGDVIRAFPVRSFVGERPRTRRLYFDTGSPFTFVTGSAARPFKAVIRLPRPEGFGGLGDGRFLARELLHLEVRLLNVWCRHAAYVVDDDVLDRAYDVLVGHDFMRRFDISIRTKARRKGVVLNQEAILMAQRVRRARVLCR